MAQINVSVQNTQTVSLNVSAFDRFANGQREVAGSPFSLASGESSPYFAVYADSNGKGHIAHTHSMPTLNDWIEVEDGQVVPI